MLTLPPERVLVREVNWGDVGLPALRAVPRAFPETHLVELIKRERATFLDGSRWIDAVIPYGIADGMQTLADCRHVVLEIR